MFSTSWCPACKQARAFFRDNAVPVQERDIDHDDAARDELKRRTGKSQIPTLVIDGDQLAPGFSTERVMAAMRASVERRLGVHGLQLERIAPGG
jgi:glutaredoxin 3